jgi:hypothetical protein
LDKLAHALAGAGVDEGNRKKKLLVNRLKTKCFRIGMALEEADEANLKKVEAFIAEIEAEIQENREEAD